MANRSLSARGAQAQNAQIDPAQIQAAQAQAAPALDPTQPTAPAGSDQAGDTTGFEGEAANVDQVEQDAYNRVVMAGMKMIFENEKSQQAIAQMLKSPGVAAAEKLSNAAFTVLTQLDEQSGGQIPEDVILPASGEILEHISELADSIKAFPVDPAVMNHAGQLLVVRLGEEYGADQADIQEFMQSIDPQTLQAVGAEQDNYANKQPESTGGI